MECDDQTAFSSITSGNNVILDWTVTGPDDGIPPAGVREPLKPAPDLPGTPVSAEPSYTDA